METLMKNNEFVENQQEATQEMAKVVSNIKLELDVNELNIVLSGLQELPHRVVDAIIRKLIEQAQGQLQ